MKFLAALFACLSTTFASATTLTTDFTDMWWVPTESGWGANLIQQGDTIFVTLFVYGTNGQPTWFVGPQTTLQAPVNGAQRFSGPLFQVSGPYFGAATFDPNTVTSRAVGTVTFLAPFVASATLSYSVDAVNVTKQVVRQTWRTENIAGSYIGATVGAFTNCSAGNGGSEVGAAYTITQTGNSVTIAEATSVYTCSYSGTLVQSGRYGTVTGTGTCSDLGAANFTASEVQASLDSVSMAMQIDFTARGSCRFSGRMGGIRRLATS